MMDKQRISLQLDAHTISLMVEREKEPVYRKATETLNKLYQYYQHAYPNFSAEQLWVHVALHVGVNLQNDAREKSLEPVEQKLQQLNSLIEQRLTQQEQ